MEKASEIHNKIMENNNVIDKLKEENKKLGRKLYDLVLENRKKMKCKKHNIKMAEISESLEKALINVLPLTSGILLIAFQKNWYVFTISMVCLSTSIFLLMKYERRTFK